MDASIHRANDMFVYKYDKFVAIKIEDEKFNTVTVFVDSEDTADFAQKLRDIADQIS